MNASSCMSSRFFAFFALCCDERSTKRVQSLARHRALKTCAKVAQKSRQTRANCETNINFILCDCATLLSLLLNDYSVINQLYCSIIAQINKITQILSYFYSSVEFLTSKSFFFDYL